MACTIRKRDEERRKTKEREESVKKSKGVVPTDQIHPSEADNSGSNSQNTKEKDPQNPNEILSKNSKKQNYNHKRQNNGKTDKIASQKQMYVAKNSTSVVQVVADSSPLPHGSPTTINTVLDPFPHGSPISLAVGVVGGKADDQEDVSGGLVGGQEKPIEPFSTSQPQPDTSKLVNFTQNGQPQNDTINSTVPTKKAKPNAQKRKAAQKKKAELEVALIASHHDKDSPQNFGKDMTSNVVSSEVQTPDEQLPGSLHSITEREEDPEEVDHFIYGQPQQTTTPDPETSIENPVPIACDPPDPVFAVCNLNTSGTRDFEADDYRQIISEDETEYNSEEEPKDTSDDAHAMQLLQTLGATNSQMSETHVKEVTDRQDLSLRGASHFSHGSGTGPPAARTRLKVKTRQPHD
ncbi:hypothetical protein HAX54_029144 [Datura stramonium]|uniref:Uncharacterized protein n=1 Tax=Datura stramonium TaxID=4076 RepID=A0ABS8V7N3_DATST|nr:hypothetical protein [Datura stramonium]